MQSADLKAEKDSALYALNSTLDLPMSDRYSIIDESHYLSDQLSKLVRAINENSGYLTPDGVDMEKLCRFIEACNAYVVMSPAKHGVGGGQSGQFAHFIENDMQTIQRMLATANKHYEHNNPALGITVSSMRGCSAQHYRRGCSH